MNAKNTINKSGVEGKQTVLSFGCSVLSSAKSKSQEPRANSRQPSGCPGMLVNADGYDRAPWKPSLEPLNPRLLEPFLPRN